MIEVQYRAAKRADAAAIAAIHAASWRDTYRFILEPEFLAGPIDEDRLSLWSDRLNNPPRTLSVEIAQDQKQQAVGFIAIHRDHDPRWGSLVDNLHVLPEARGHGIGERLLRLMVRRLEAQGASDGLYLWIFEANQAALRFYLRLGAEVVGRDRSRIPAANGKPILRLHWPNRSSLL